MQAVVPFMLEREVFRDKKGREGWMDGCGAYLIS
jgi:hypothetical protein